MSRAALRMKHKGHRRGLMHSHLNVCSRRSAHYLLEDAAADAGQGDAEGDAVLQPSTKLHHLQLSRVGAPQGYGEQDADACRPEGAEKQTTTVKGVPPNPNRR